ncbi:DUF3219 family protein [Salinicoccus albus]|uniref:DUF3219 family protein n=1 Tax=Salinicoccus albus TaxID=418756 RepID=UPI0003A5B733|nr:DUF3219 family protein [Salinicoccus albus]
MEKITLNNQEIELKEFQQTEENGRIVVSVVFDVTSEEYHDVSVLLYEEKFDIEVPGKDMKFKGVISQFSTSIDNLYEEDNVGEYRVTFTEIE